MSKENLRRERRESPGRFKKATYIWHGIWHSIWIYTRIFYIISHLLLMLFSIAFCIIFFSFRVNEDMVAGKKEKITVKNILWIEQFKSGILVEARYRGSLLLHGGAILHHGSHALSQPAS